ncbi:glucose-1-phosphate adenylyltransferase [Psychromonas sp. Urea-02u-13]|uniref:glucose-1-phosphate adenylyltransferase n=1 Tax=Psychromonas sp. Urea-02u-13 TaxID=2058326 RepID=UPI000C327487|nr:glucose-1-phosphate adenylyltransferase [Psychromonas sp. Urea-02u-13]PKG39607.1 glucose-1-phosphate adenylyltransferase [Psychromonas sp. Urea-02u-13]
MSQHIGLITRDTIALILAGGKGSRLKQLTEDRAKPGLPFGGKYKIIDFTLSNCMNSGIRRIDVLTQYKSSELLSHVQKAWSRMPWELGEYVNIVPAQQQIGDLWYRGTADAVYQNLKQLRKQHCKYVLILGGDHIYKMDYSRMLRRHAKNKADISIATIPVNCKSASAFGVLNTDKEMRVIDFVEKPENPPEMASLPGKSLVSMGVYIFNFDILEQLLLEDACLDVSQHDFGYNIIPKAINEHAVYAYIFDADGCADVQAYWKDVGTIDQYFSANLDLVQVEPELNLYDKHWPIYSFQEQLPGAKFIFDQESCRGQAVDSVITAGCIISGASVKKSLLSTCVTVERHSELERCVILPNVSIGRHCKLLNVLVVEDCIIPDGFTIGYDLESDKNYYEISESGVILVTQAMIDNFLKIEHGG